MSKMVFVPLSDEMIYEHPELIKGPIGAFAPKSVSFPNSTCIGEKREHYTLEKKHQVSAIDGEVGWASDCDRAGTRT